MIQHLLLYPLLLSLSITLFGQEPEFDLFYEVYPTAEGFTLSLEALDTVATLKDLNKHYEEDWVSTYGEVTLTTTHNGKTFQYKSKDDTLTTEQLAAIKSADNGSSIAVSLTYLPVGETDPSALRNNNFSFTIDPQDAEYAGGKTALLAYLEKTIDKIPLAVFDIYNAYSINFTIDPAGTVVDAHIENSTEDETVNTLLLDAICNMSQWQPAHYRDGKTTRQDFVFVIGDKSSCTMNVLDIKNWTPPSN